MTTTAMTPMKIEKTVLLRASRAKVWAALSDAKQYGAWFGAELDRAFTPGAHVTGKIVPTTVDAEVAKSQQAYAGAKFELWIERVEPERLLSFRWHPFAVDPAHDYSGEPKTLVVFELEDAPGGILLRVTETGFEGVLAARRVKAFEMNASGWEMQARLVAKYLADAK